MHKYSYILCIDFTSYTYVELLYGVVNLNFDESPFQSCFVQYMFYHFLIILSISVSIYFIPSVTHNFSRLVKLSIIMVSVVIVVHLEGFLIKVQIHLSLIPISSFKLGISVSHNVRVIAYLFENSKLSISTVEVANIGLQNLDQYTVSDT